MDKIVQSIVIHAPINTCYTHWLEGPHLPQFTGHLQTLYPGAQDVWQWSVPGAKGQSLVWYATTLQCPSAVKEVTIRYSGIATFEDIVLTQTRLSVALEYDVSPEAMQEQTIRLKAISPLGLVLQDLQDFKIRVESQRTAPRNRAKRLGDCSANAQPLK